MSDEPTSFFEKIGEGIGKGLVRGIISLALAAGVFGGSVVVSQHHADEAAQPGRDINSGTNWVGKNMLDSHNEIWSNAQEIAELKLRIKKIEEK